MWIFKYKNKFAILFFNVQYTRLEFTAMPALTANSVTLDEILVVRAGPLREEELWALLSQSSAALQDVFIKGKLWYFFFKDVLEQCSAEKPAAIFIPVF